MELIDGEIIVMSPSGLESDEVAAEICRQLGNWVRPRRLGRITASSAGYRLPNPNGDVRAPDTSFVKAERLRRTTEDFAQLVPDLMFEVMSKTDSWDNTRAKIWQFLELGTQVGVLVDPRTRVVRGLPPGCGATDFAGWRCANGTRISVRLGDGNFEHLGTRV